MNNKRIQRIERQIQKDLSEIFLAQTRRMPGVMISVTQVRISPDLSQAKAYLSIFPSHRSAELLKNITQNAKALRFELGTRIGQQLRCVPELTFFLDDSLDYLENIDKLLQN
jgi:ribosome-binding factor A